jgi:DNA-binding transcriptional LysR family regulator
MLNLRFVDTLREVAARGSFSAAAQALSYTQPAVSRQIALLEREAGLPLVVRTRRGVHLTRAGRLVVEHAEDIQARLRRLDDELGALGSGTRVSVALGGFPTAFVGLVPEIVRRVRAEHQDPEIELRRCGHEEAVAAVRRAELDVALVFGSADAGAGGDVERVDLFDEPMLALLPRAHPAADADEVELGSLRDDGWIVGAPDPASSLIANACRAAGFEPRVVFETDDPLAIQSLVAAGLGVSLTTPWLRTAMRDDVVLRPLAPPAPTRRVQAVFLPPETVSARVLLEVARAVGAEVSRRARGR